MNEGISECISPIRRGWVLPVVLVLLTALTFFLNITLFDPGARLDPWGMSGYKGGYLTDLTLGCLNILIGLGWWLSLDAPVFLNWRFGDIIPAVWLCSGTCSHRHDKQALLVMLILILLCFVGVCGAVSYRVYGGWYDFPIIDARFIFSGSVCALLQLSTGSPLLALYSGFMIYMSSTINVECYESMARDDSRSNDCAGDPHNRGLFDWLLGHAGSTSSAHWPLFRRWARDMVGLALRGLFWTLPLGFLLRAAHFKLLFATSGILMGLLYEIGFRTPLSWAPFSEGTSMSEGLMGFWLFFVLLVTVLGPRVNKDSVLLTHSSPETIAVDLEEDASQFEYGGMTDRPRSMHEQYMDIAESRSRSHSHSRGLLNREASIKYGYIDLNMKSTAMHTATISERIMYGLQVMILTVFGMTFVLLCYCVAETIME